MTNNGFPPVIIGCNVIYDVPTVINVTDAINAVKAINDN